jgi:hypothetical protein
MLVVVVDEVRVAVDDHAALLPAIVLSTESGLSEMLSIPS